MCGINGIYGIKDKTISGIKIREMNGHLSHRGPDDDGTFVNENIALGHRRLSIIDLSAMGHQPMAYLDGRYQIVYNGELYNFREIKNEIIAAGAGKIEFKTETDTEVILAAYHVWGMDCVAHFNGMFAFAIWDELKKELVIFRDRLGIKPLYYSLVNNVLVFSSEMRALLSSGIVKRKLDHNGLVDYLRYQTVHAPKTIIENVSMLMPGHYMKVSGNNIQLEAYWEINKNISKASAGKTYPQVCADVRTLMMDSVERRLISDVPFGAFLSGGIDSSAVVGLMSRVSREKVKTFSVVFDEQEFSEAPFARMISEKFSTDHHELKLSIRDFMDDLPAALKAQDHPSVDGFNTYVVSKATKKAGITMALSGLGGDELFAGYDIFPRTLRLQKLDWITFSPLFFRKISGNILKNLRPGIATQKTAELLKQKNFDLFSTYPVSRQVLMDSQISSLMQNQVLPTNSVLNILNEKIITENPENKLSNISISEVSTYMQNVLLRDTDQMSMAHALEVRVPFLDYTLVEYVLGVPDKFKFPITPKKLLVDSMGKLLPSEIVNRPKMGFTFPWKHWLKNELKDLCEQRIDALSKRSLFNEVSIRNMWNQFMNDDPNITWARIWLLVVLENWLQENKINE